jgi:hypothetical protein
VTIIELQVAIEKLIPAMPIVTDMFKVMTPQQEINPAKIARMNLPIVIN